MSDYEKGMWYAQKAFQKRERDRETRRAEMLKQKAIGTLLCILALGMWAVLAVGTEEGVSGLWWGIAAAPVMMAGIYTMVTKRNWLREINEMGETV